VNARILVARHARLTRLAVLAALRSAGWVPWLLGTGWILFAALQEPRLLRLHGIQLVGEAARVAAVALAIVLGAAAPIARPITTYLFVNTALTFSSVAFVSLVAAGTELVRGTSATELEVGAAALACTLPPLAAFASLVAVRREPIAIAIATMGAVVSLAVIGREASTFSLSAALASIAGFGAAAALASGHCREHA
jgi:hypothetical protein